MERLSLARSRPGAVGASAPSERPDDVLAEVRGLVRAEQLLEVQLAEAVRRARAAGVDSIRLSAALGVHRATLYRRFPVGAS